MEILVSYGVQYCENFAFHTELFDNGGCAVLHSVLLQSAQKKCANLFGLSNVTLKFTTRLKKCPRFCSCDDTHFDERDAFFTLPEVVARVHVMP